VLILIGGEINREIIQHLRNLIKKYDLVRHNESIKSYKISRI